MIVHLIQIENPGPHSLSLFLFFLFFFFFLPGKWRVAADPVNGVGFSGVEDAGEDGAMIGKEELDVEEEEEEGNWAEELGHELRQGLAGVTEEEGDEYHYAATTMGKRKKNSSALGKKKKKKSV